MKTKDYKKLISPQLFYINLEIYPFSVLFSINQKDSTLKKALSNLDYNEIDPIFENCKGKAIVLQNGNVIIRLVEMSSLPQDIGDLSHEIFHACCFVMSRVGISFDMETSDEAYAYLIGFITKKVFQNIKFN